MQLSNIDIVDIYNYLNSKLRSARFNVRTNKYGIISNVSKFGINCCPCIEQSTLDGKNGYSKLVNSFGVYDSSDLGFYYKKRDTDGNRPLYTNNFSLDKYDVKNGVKIDNRNYKKVIDEFVELLNKDYLNIGKVKLNNSLKESIGNRVKIVNTDTIFDGKEGIVEQETDDEVIVFVDFDDRGHKVRNNFKLENVVDIG